MRGKRLRETVNAVAGVNPTDSSKREDNCSIENVAEGVTLAAGPSEPIQKKLPNESTGRLPKTGGRVKQCGSAVVGQFDVEAALRRHLVRQPTDKLAATASN